MQLFYKEDIQNTFLITDSSEYNHLVRVLRSNLGDRVFFTDGKGKIYETELVELKPKEAYFTVINERSFFRQLPYLHIAIAPTKMMDRMEWFVEKATELGVDEISWIKTQRSERKEIKNYDRLEKCAISAIKQSKNPYLPKFNELRSFTDFLKSQKDFTGTKYIAYCAEDSEKKHEIVYADHVLFLIGPEGDFTEEEVNIAFKENMIPCSLGANILRTETAGIYVTSMVNSMRLSRH